MKDIAIYFKKIDLTNDLYVFKPCNIIKGSYDEDTMIFTTLGNIECEPLDGGELDEEHYYWHLTTLEELKENNAKIDETQLLEDYFNKATNYVYIGVFNISAIKLLQISKDKILYEKHDLTVEMGENPNNLRYIFDAEYLKNILNLETIEDIRDTFKEIMKLGDQIKKEEACYGMEQDEILEEIPSNKTATIEQKIMSLKELRKEVLSKIVGQDEAVYDITRAILINQRAENPRNKSHILVTGPTGTGKTEITKTICRTLNLPFFEADITAYTQEGYIGKSVYSMLTGLINNAGSIEQAQNGILVIDEIDKKILYNLDKNFGLSVLYSLLKIMDRGTIELNTTQGPINFDTSNLTIIFTGAFEALYENILKKEKHQLGFNTNKVITPKSNLKITKNDLIQGGTPTEFLGRIGEITSTNFFEQSSLIKLLNTSTISPILLQREFLKKSFNIELLTTDNYINIIAKKALDSRTNARELSSLVKESMKYAMDEILSGREVKTLKLTAKTAADPKYYYIK